MRGYTTDEMLQCFSAFWKFILIYDKLSIITRLDYLETKTTPQYNTVLLDTYHS
jgi:hypothetical protein